MRGCRPLTDLELSHLLETLAFPRWRRERLLVLLGVRTGLRLSSMLQLRVVDVAFAGEVQDRIRVRWVTTKGKRSGYDLVRTSYALRHRSVATTVTYLSFKEEDVDAAIVVICELGSTIQVQCTSSATLGTASLIPLSDIIISLNNRFSRSLL